MILDNNAEPIWFLPLETVVAQNFRVQTYQRRPVLTWYEGPADGTYGGTCVIYDSAYRHSPRSRGASFSPATCYEFLIT